MTAPRMAWLDGLRGVAVLLVVYAHLTRYVFTDLRAFTGEWLHAGTAGVMLFFLVSGYIIPASLERHGDQRAFWRSRALRLFPLYLVMVAVLAALSAPSFGTLAGHATMLPFLLGVPLLTPVFWTLSFEMAFYLLVSGLFALRWRRADGVMAVALAVLGVVTAPLVFRGTVSVGLAVVILAAGLAGVVSGRRWAVLGGGALLAGLALTLLLVNQDPAHAWDGLLIIAVMFTGTTIYRADAGRIPWWRAGLVAAVVAAAVLVNWLRALVALDGFTPGYIARTVITLVVFGGAFAAGLLTRRRRTPRWLARLGVLSYSVYLVHYVLIQWLAPVLRSEVPDVLLAAGYLTLVIGVSWATHRWIEVPAQRLGRRPAAPPARERPEPAAAVSGPEDA